MNKHPMPTGIRTRILHHHLDWCGQALSTIFIPNPRMAHHSQITSPHKPRPCSACPGKPSPRKPARKACSACPGKTLTGMPTWRLPNAVGPKRTLAQSLAPFSNSPSKRLWSWLPPPNIGTPGPTARRPAHPKEQQNATNRPRRNRNHHKATLPARQTTNLTPKLQSGGNSRKLGVYLGLPVSGWWDILTRRMLASSHHQTSQISFSGAESVRNSTITARQLGTSALTVRAV